MNKAATRTRTPCIGVCSTALGGSVCRGCKRYAHEVIDWNRYSEPQKLAIEQRLTTFLTQAVQMKLEIVDVPLLQQQMARHTITLPLSRNIYCQAFVFCRAYASQISNPSAIGLLVKPVFQRVPLKTLCEQIDEEFYALSVAHFERSFVDFS